MIHWWLVTCPAKPCSQHQMVFAAKCPSTDDHTGQDCISRVSCQKCGTEAEQIVEIRRAT